MLQVDSPVDQAIAKAVERRRAAETARKARIFNTRLCLMGLDTDALNQQVQDKRHQQNLERQRDQAFDKLRRNHDEMLLQSDMREREMGAAVLADLTHCWTTQQRAEDSCDTGLKCGLQEASKLTIPESELGPASMQILQREGLGEEEKKREQIKKTERDLRAQKEYNERKRLGDRHKEMVHQDQWWQQQHTLEEECKKATRIALDNYNRALAVEQAEKQREQRRREERENLAEMVHTLTSNVMTEGAVQQVGEGRPPQVLTDRWKGMSPEQLRTIHMEREAQRLERQRRRDAEKFQDAVWDFQLLRASREAEEEERRTAELRRERRMQTDQYNLQLAREQQAYQQYLDKKLYTNTPTKDYFHQFNTSSR
ncbi:RIB43A-like with coiled-coils protein 1 [Aulostomus maculatus]